MSHRFLAHILSVDIKVFDKSLWAYLSKPDVLALEDIFVHDSEFWGLNHNQNCCILFKLLGNCIYKFYG